MGKSKHHYVPRFYLKKFASASRRINVCKIDDRSCYQDVGLKDQCYRTKLYGQTDHIENSLMQIETAIAPTLAAIVQSSTLPKPSTNEHKDLLLFVALQVSRTPIAAESMAGGYQQVLSRIETRHPDKEIVDAENLRMQPGNTLIELLKGSAFIAQCFEDLGIHLVLNRGIHKFITSDNPAVQYNQYCEGINQGNTGALRRGLQIFLPLSPQHLVIFYDRKVYKVDDLNTALTEISKEDDLLTLNFLQAANAEKVILFSDWREVEVVKRTVSRALKYRRVELSHIDEFIAEDDPEHVSMIQVYQPSLNLKLGLSFMRLRRAAQKMPRNKRAIEYRVSLRPKDDDMPRGYRKAVRRYVRRQPEND